MRDNAVEKVILRNNFYRDNYRRVVFALLVMLAINVALVAMIGYLLMNPPKPQYFATSSDGKIMPLVPLDKPNLSQAAVLDYAAQAATAAYTYNFVQYRKNLQDAQTYFTPAGWQDFLSTLRSSNNLRNVTQNKLIATAVPTSAPVIRQEGILRGVYAWKIGMTMLVTYEGLGGTRQQSLNVLMLVVREPTLNNPRGIGISQFVAAEGRNPVT